MIGKFSTLFASAMRFMPAGAGAVWRWAEDKLRESVSVKDFGAKGDGITDDTAAFNAAIAYAKANSVKCIKVPSGNYKTTGPINIMGNFNDGFELRGYRATITATANGPAFVIDAKNPDSSPEIRIHALVHGFDIHGPGKASLNSVAVQAQHGANVHVKDCSLYNCYRGLYGNGNLISQYENLHIYGNAYGIDLATDGTFAANDIHFTNCQVINNDHAIRAVGFPNGAITFEGCEIEGNNLAGALADGVKVIEFTNAGKVTFKGCHMEDNPGQYNLYYDGNSGEHLNVIGCEIIPGDTCTYPLYMANVSGAANLFVAGSRITNNVGQTQIYLSAGVTAEVIGKTNGYIGGDLSHLVTLQNGLVNIGRQDWFAGGGAGIAFPPAQLPSTDPNTLDDYEEGTWTPTIIGASTAGAAHYTYQNGRYTKIGRQVFVEAFVQWDSGTATGDFYLAGLPFVVQNALITYPAANIARSANFTWTAGNRLLANFEPGTTQIHFFQAPQSGGAVSTVPVPATGQLMISGTYTV
jgi:hypothetical protein